MYQPGQKIRNEINFNFFVCRYLNINHSFSELWFWQIITHEIGHQLGMGHDFVGMDSTQLKTGPDGKKCNGFMDYNETTDQWSKCSNADMKKFLNSLKKNCLMRKKF